MRELSVSSDLDSILVSMTDVSNEKKMQILDAVEVTAIDKAKNEMLPNLYAKSILWLFCGINVAVIGIVIAGFLVDSGIFGSPKNTDRFITSNVLMALIAGVTIEVSLAIRSMSNVFFRAQNSLSESQSQIPAASKTP